MPFYPISPEELSRLRQMFTGRKVQVRVSRPELRRFQGRTGQVIAVNCNGRLLVQFEGEDRSRYDLWPTDVAIVEEDPPGSPQAAPSPDSGKP
jgi:hypothetical protein